MTLRDDRFDTLTDEQLLRINGLCNAFEASWKAGGQPAIETLLEGLADNLRWPAIRELLPLEIEYRRRAGHSLSSAEFTSRFPQVDPAWLSELVATANDAAPVGPAALDSPMPDQLGDYRLLGRIGGGGMGTVYKAVHQRMGRSVALKVLRAEMQRDPALLKRFDREVRAAARLTHPNIVAALDAREQDGLHYLITELVEGCDLEETVRRDGPMSVQAAVDCVWQAACGLDYAHRQGVIHRDIKPANLLRDQAGVVKVLDMGLARLDTLDEAAATNLTKSGMVMGTAAYMAPEQARDTRRADARSDLYSLGCTLYFLLTGRPVFAGETIVDTILSHVSQPIPSLAGSGAPIPAGLDEVFRRLIAKEPADRYQSAAEVMAALEPFRDGERVSNVSRPHPIAVAPSPTILLENKTVPTRHAAAERTGWRRRWPSLAGSLIGVIAICAILYRAFFHDPGMDEFAEHAGLEFNGQSSYVAVPDLEPTAGETYTLEAIVRPSEFRTASNVISWLGRDWMAIYLGGDGNWGLSRLWESRSYLVSSKSMAARGTWVHIAGVFQGAALHLFIDGKRTETDPVKFSLPETHGGLFIGGVSPDRLPPNQNDRFFHGAIASVRISRGVRYTDNFQPPTHFRADSNTVALFPFPEGHGTQTRSSDARSWTGEIVNGQWIEK